VPQLKLHALFYQLIKQLKILRVNNNKPMLKRECKVVVDMAEANQDQTWEEQ
jgi:hypothetical protein